MFKFTNLLLKLFCFIYPEVFQSMSIFSINSIKYCIYVNFLYFNLIKLVDNIYTGRHKYFDETKVKHTHNLNFLHFEPPLQASIWMALWMAISRIRDRAPRSPPSSWRPWKPPTTTAPSPPAMYVSSFRRTRAWICGWCRSGSRTGASGWTPHVASNN